MDKTDTGPINYTFNASKSINYATPMWNKHIYLTPNSVETNTHVSTLHSTIRKQLSKIGQSTEWHFNTQPPVGVQISLKYSTLKCTRLTSPQYPVRILGISSCHVEPDTVDPNHHICIGNPTIICSDDGLSPSRRQATIWTNAAVLSIGPRGTNFREILIEILTFSFKTIRLKVSPTTWRPFCLGRIGLKNRLMYW